MKTKQSTKTFLILGLLVLGAIFLSLSLGYTGTSAGDLLGLLTGQADPATHFIILGIRLPRVLACILGGASLGLAGILLQTLTKNPLADSGILGINAGAGLVMALVISLSPSLSPQITALLPFLAMLGGAASILLVYLIARQKNHNISPTRLIIAGVGMSSMLSSVMVAIVSRTDSNKMDYIISWLSGKISGNDWQTLALLFPILLGLCLVSFSRSRSLNLMTLNDQTALALGLNLQRERLIILLLSTALASLSVVLVGNITFLGLVAGHIAKRLLGGQHQASLPAAMLVGILLLLLADTLGRNLLVGTGMPTGIILSILGAPYFLSLMLKQEDQL